VPRCRLSTYGYRAFHYAGPTARHGVYNEMRYINLRFTYLLTYLLVDYALSAVGECTQSQPNILLNKTYFAAKFFLTKKPKEWRR